MTDWKRRKPIGSYYNNSGKKWWGLELNSNGHGVLWSAVRDIKNEKNHKWLTGTGKKIESRMTFKFLVWVAIEVKDYEVGLGWAEDEMKPVGGKEIGYPTYADAYWTVSFPLHFLWREKSSF